MTWTRGAIDGEMVDLPEDGDIHIAGKIDGGSTTSFGGAGAHPRLPHVRQARLVGHLRLEAQLERGGTRIGRLAGLTVSSEPFQLHPAPDEVAAH